MTMMAEHEARNWSDAVVRAAAEASRLQPLATFLFVGAMLLIAGQHAAEPLSYAFASGEPEEGWRELGRHLIEATPAVALSFALLEMRAYLSRLAKGSFGALPPRGCLGGWGPHCWVRLRRPS